MEAIAAFICLKTGVKSITAAFDHAVASRHFASPHDALQRLFAWAAQRNHIKLLHKLNAMRNALPSPPRVAVDPAVDSPRAVWEILLPDALARRGPAEQLELLQEAMVKYTLVGDASVLRYLLAVWQQHFPPAAGVPFGTALEWHRQQG